MVSKASSLFYEDKLYIFLEIVLHLLKIMPPLGNTVVQGLALIEALEQVLDSLSRVGCHAPNGRANRWVFLLEAEKRIREEKARAGLPCKLCED